MGNKIQLDTVQLSDLFSIWCEMTQSLLVRELSGLILGERDLQRGRTNQIQTWYMQQRDHAECFQSHTYPGLSVVVCSSAHVLSWFLLLDLLHTCAIFVKYTTPWKRQQNDAKSIEHNHNADIYTHQDTVLHRKMRRCRSLRKAKILRAESKGSFSDEAIVPNKDSLYRLGRRDGTGTGEGITTLCVWVCVGLGGCGAVAH